MPSLTVAGIDVGSSRKGFHAVALRDGGYLDQIATRDAGQLRQWCLKVDARIIGVDAPCHWSLTGRARPAERELMAEKIWCFSTPTHAMALAHPKDHYGWMRAGAELFRLLKSTHELYDGGGATFGKRVCFETFPHAVACALRGEIVSAKNKQRDRSALLAAYGVNLPSGSSIDVIDAALCALVAKCFLMNKIRCYGDVVSGLIVVPTPIQI